MKKTNFDFIKEQWVKQIQERIERYQNTIDKIKEYSIEEYILARESGDGKAVYLCYDPTIKIEGNCDKELIRQQLKAFLLMDFSKEFQPLPMPNIGNVFDW